MADNIAYSTHGLEVTKSGRCSISGKLYEVTITQNQFLAWRVADQQIKVALCNLDSDQRNFWQTGMTPLEWRRIFSEENADGKDSL